MIGGHIGTHLHSYASALVRAAKIGPSAQFTTEVFVNIERTHGTLTYSGKSRRELYGHFGSNVTNRYLGVKFLINGETHYGWIRFFVDTKRGDFFSATISAYAYETVPNRRILAGIPENQAIDAARRQSNATPAHRAFLGMLALGIDGLPLWRREMSATSQ